MAFQSPVDIGKRACQHIGNFPITAFSDDSQQAKEINTCYDNLRLAELSRHTWTCSIRRARVRPISLSAQVWTPPTWAVGTNYVAGNCVMFASSTYANGANYPWILQAPTSTGDNPDTSPKWSHMFSSMIADVFDSGATYAAGEVALIPATYAGGTTYQKNAIVQDAVTPGQFWVSLQNANTGNTPASSPTFWTPWVTPSSGIQTTPQIIVYQTAPTVFLSLYNNNGPIAPATTATIPSASPYWISVGGTVAQLSILFPVGTGPVTQGTVSNLYPLPFGWLRPAINFAKDTARPWLGALYGPTDGPDTYTYYGNYFTTQNTTAYGSFTPYIDLTFVADIADVTIMAPQFCESLAIRIADEIDPAMTDNKNQARLARKYAQITGEALRVDSIIQGTPTQQMDEFIRVRW